MTATLAPAPQALRLRPRVRRAVLTLHIVASVGLLGDVAVIVAINVRAATTSDAQLAASAYELLSIFPVLFGIPLSLTSYAGDRARGVQTRPAMAVMRLVSGRRRRGYGRRPWPRIAPCRPA